MQSIIKLLRNLIYKYFGGSAPKEQAVSAPEVREQTKAPQINKIETEAVFGMKDDYLVVMIDHEFQDIPNWVEWDAVRKMVNITHQGGDMDEVFADIKEEHIDALVDAKRILLVSNDNTKKRVHFLPFLARK